LSAVPRPQDEPTIESRYDNTIEQLFSKLKHFTRAGEPRTVEATWRRVGHVLDLVAPNECANYLTNSGYASV